MGRSKLRRRVTTQDLIDSLVLVKAWPKTPSNRYSQLEITRVDRMGFFSSILLSVTTALLVYSYTSKLYAILIAAFFAAIIGDLVGRALYHLLRPRYYNPDID